MNVFRWLWRQLWVTVVLALVLLALYTSIGRQLMPLLETKQTEVETWLSTKLNLPVSMSSLKGDWQGLMPVLRIKNLNIAGEQGLTFKKVTAELNLSASIFYRTPVFERILVSGTYGKITQLSENEWQITPDWKVHFTDKQDESHKNSEIVADWLTLQEYISLKDVEAQISTLDSQKDSLVDSLHLRQLRWRSLGGQHELNVDLAWGRQNSANIRVQAFLDGALWPWDKQQARVYVNLEEQDWSSWLDFSDNDAFGIKQLQGAAQGWLNIRNGNLESVYLTSEITQVTLALANDEFTLGQGTLRLAGKHSDNDWHLKLLPQFSQPLPLSTLQLSEVSIDSQKAWQVGVPELDVQHTRELLERYELLPEKIAYFIEGTAPNGVAKDVRLSFLQDKQTDRWKFDVKASLENIESKAFHGIPKLSGVSADLHAQPLAGRVRFHQQDIGLHLPDIYTPAWQLEQLQGDFRWLIMPDHAELQLEGAQAQLVDNHNPKTAWPLTADLNILLPRHSNTEPSLGLLLALPQAPVALQQQLVPNVVGKEALEWLEQTDLSGQVQNALFALQMEIGQEQPPNSHSSLLSLNLNDTSLTYLPEWPEVSKLAGRLMLDSPDLDVSIEAGETLGGQLQEGQVRLHNGRLQVDAQLEGDSREAMRYFTETPLQEALDHALDDWQVQGTLSASLNLDLPLGQDDPNPHVRLQAQLRDNQLLLPDLDLAFAKLNGKVEYDSSKGLRSDLIEGETLGGPFSVNLRSNIDAEQHFNMALQGKGSATWQGFHQWQKISVFEPIQGRLNYDVKLLLSDGDVEVQLTSDLLGTDIDLPPPFNKEAQQPRSLKVQLQAGATNILQANYDQRVQAALAIEADTLPRGQVMLGGATAQLGEQSGIEIRGTLTESLVFEQWWESFYEISHQASEHHSDLVNAEEIIRYIDLTLLDLHAFDVPLGNTHIQAQLTPDYWQATVDSPVVKGDIDVPIAQAPMRLNLDYLLLPQPEAVIAEDEQLAATQAAASEEKALDRLADFDPSVLPTIEASVNEFFIGGRHYGNWQFESTPIKNGIEVTVLESDLYGLESQGRLQWRLEDGQPYTQLQDVKLKTNDVGALQRGFRLVPVIEGKKLTGSLNLGWQGSPIAFDVESLKGNVHLRVRNGYIVTEEAKALKALGALNFGSVSRRLKLDFSDLYEEGVSFDDLRFHSQIEDSVLTLTEPMLVDGPGGKFLTSGSTHLMDHSLDMKVAITLPVTGNLPLVAVLAGLSPPVAASIYITEKLIGDELSRFTSASYSLQGTWEEPDMKIKKAFDDKVDGKEKRGLKSRILGIFGLGKD